MNQEKNKTLSLTEWLERIQFGNAIAFREEDNAKRYRLEDLQKITGLPTDKLSRFTAQEVADRAPAFQEAAQAIGNKNCALRLVPINPSLPKLRIFCVPTTEALTWFDAQTINHQEYRVELMPRPSDHVWSTILVVNEHGVFGEIVADTHDRLTQGTTGDVQSIAFSFDFTEWRLSEENAAALAHVQELVRMLFVDEAAKRLALEEKLHATFSQNYLCGYFETVCSKEFGIWFIDYNRLLGTMYGDAHVVVNSIATLRGQTGCPGLVTGRARLVRANDIANAKLPAGDILVIDMTTPECLPLMQRASAIVTQYGGSLSPAAITCRELHVPCIVGVRDLFDHIHDGDLIRVDAENGTIQKL